MDFKRLCIVGFMAFVVSSSALSQITITKSDMPVSGDTIRYSVALFLGDTEMDSTGADVNWDFTDLGVVRQGVRSYVRSTQTPYILNFGFTALGEELADTLGFAAFQFKNVFNFYQSSNSSFSDVGIGFQFSSLPIPQAGKHSDPDEIYQFPLNFGDVDTSTFNVKVPISAGFFTIGDFFRKGTRINIVDGWGKISTPYANDVECIRVKTVINEFDSIKVSTPSFGFGQPVNTVEYKWLSKTEHIPILVVRGSELTGSFVPTAIEYRDNFRTIGPPVEVTADFAASDKFPKSGNVVSFTNLSSGPDLTFKWSVPSSSDILFVNGTDASSENPRIIFNESGLHDIQLIATSGNTSDTMMKSAYLDVDGKSSTPSTLIKKDILVYPNPTSREVNVMCSGGSSINSIEVIDQKGVFLSLNTTQVANGHFLLNTTTLSNGLYQLRISTDDGVAYKTLTIINN
jgi:PKD repeat protein